MDDNGNTLLHTSIRNRRIEIANYLMEIGSNIEVKNKKEETAFSIAIKENLIVIIERLIKLEIDIRKEDITEASPSAQRILISALESKETKEKVKKQLKEIYMEQIKQTESITYQNHDILIHIADLKCILFKNNS